MRDDRTVPLHCRAWILLPAALLCLPAIALAQGAARDVGTEEEEARSGSPEYSPYIDRAYSNWVFWGDTHLHTSYSTDAGMIGNFLGPDEAFRFARGETVTASGGQRAKLIRPLDFLVVADHAENLGLAPLIAESDPNLLRIPWAKKVHDLVKAGDPFGAYAAWGAKMAAGEDPIDDDEMIRTVWNRIVDSAERFNEPGLFTALHGFEWTSSPEANNLHRVVIFRDDADKVRDLVPFSNYDSSDPEDLWKWLQGYQRKTGGRVFAIAHNGNLSNGLMFDDKMLGGKPLTRDYAERRSFWEPLYEVTQIKGDGEAHPFLSPNDEFADFGTWDKGNLNLSELKTDDMLAGEYARSGLKRGLQLEAELGINPFKYGLVGATDSHTGLSTADDDNYFGKTSGMEPSAERMIHPFATFGGVSIMGWETLASGYQAIWAPENTREALFDAMERKETYATTGPRILVRFFGGWDFEGADASTRQPAVIGYQKGVPMGGDLSDAPAGTSPSFLVAALKDPIGANLDRIQIVKGWRTASGELEERVYDVAVSDGRTIGADGRATTPVGDTVDVENASWTNTIGDTELITCGSIPISIGARAPSITWVRSRSPTR